MPKVGTVEKEQIRDSVWAASARTLTAFNAQALFDLPIMDSVYPCVTSIASGTANVFGSWVQISADVGVGKRLIGAEITPGYGVGVSAFEIEFGEGAAGAEVAIARISGKGYCASSAAYRPMYCYPLWKSLSTNVRLSVRVRNDTANAYGYDVAALIA